MLVTIYTRDLEPITVVRLAPWAIAMLKEHGHIALAAMPRHVLAAPEESEIPLIENWVVRLRGDEIRLGGARTWILTTSDEEVALALKSAFLPGQVRDVKEREHEARGEGMRMAIDLIRRLGGDA